MLKKVCFILLAVMLFGFVGKAQIIENVDYRIKSAWSGRYLYIEDINKPLLCSDVQPGWQSAKWKFQNVNGNFWIKNSWDLKQCVFFDEGLKCGEIQAGWQSAQWIFEKIEGSNQYRIKNIWNNTYLYIDGYTENGQQYYYPEVKCGEIQNGWKSAKWILEKQ